MNCRLAITTTGKSLGSVKSGESVGQRLLLNRQTKRPGKLFARKVPPGQWMSLSCKFCLLSGRGLCFGLITRHEESY
jgi:hypothetical protein